jgi:hypothetical protein
MFLSVLIAVGMAVCVIFLSWIGIELTIRAPQNDAAKLRTRLGIAASAALLISLTVWSTERSETELNNLPERVADYIVNTTPPAGLPPVVSHSPPAPPTGLIGAWNGDWGLSAIGMGSQLTNFLNAQGDAPARKPGESDLSFISRSNAWYSNVMGNYKKQFAGSVASMVHLLIGKGVLDKRVADLARDPINPIGIRALAAQLETGGENYKKQYGAR